MKAYWRCRAEHQGETAALVDGRCPTCDEAPVMFWTDWIEVGLPPSREKLVRGELGVMKSIEIRL